MAKQKTTKDQVSKPDTTNVQQKRTYIKQSDVPLMSLDDALRIPQAILDNYAGKPTAPLYVAKVLNIDPKGAQFKFLSGAAIAYGLIEGGAQASTISISELTKKILRPKEDGSDLVARREAVLIPRVFKEFLAMYDGNMFPREDIAVNVLEEMGVPREKAPEVLQRIESSATSVGFIEVVKDKKYVTLFGVTPSVTEQVNEPNEKDKVITIPDDKKTKVTEKTKSTVPPLAFPKSSTIATAIADDARRRKVFISHGKNKELLEPIKKLLEYGELIPIVSIERQSVSKPVPEKVMDDMRGCGAGIIHVDAEKVIVDKTDQEHVIISPNVLIEIGAALAFYGKRFILLVKNGVKLPSNLQGLYEVRYTGDTIDASSAIKLLEAIKDIKNYSLPTDINSLDQ